MRKHKYKKLLLKKYDTFSMEENETKKKLLQFEVQNILKSIEEPDSEDFYIWGLTYYFMDNKDYYEVNLGLEKFVLAYELDSNNFLACLYIAHSFQDRKEYESALEYYTKVNQNQLKEFQLWRYVKLIEQIGYCYFKLGKKDIGRKKFEEVLSWYKKTELGVMVVPLELIECLDELDEIVQEIKKIEDYL